jgi:hypothetical protein
VELLNYYVANEKNIGKVKKEVKKKTNPPEERFSKDHSEGLFKRDSFSSKMEKEIPYLPDEKDSKSEK